MRVNIVIETKAYQNNTVEFCIPQWIGLILLKLISCAHWWNIFCPEFNLTNKMKCRKYHRVGGFHKFILTSGHVYAESFYLSILTFYENECHLSDSC